MRRVRQSVRRAGRCLYGSDGLDGRYRMAELRRCIEIGKFSRIIRYSGSENSLCRYRCQDERQVDIWKAQGQDNVGDAGRAQRV